MTLPRLPVVPVRCGKHECLDTACNDEDFLHRVSGLAHRSLAAILLSGGNSDCSRYSVAAYNPFMVFRSKGRHCWLDSPMGNFTIEQDPLETLDRLCSLFEPDFPLVSPPFSGGAVGYFAYEVKNTIESLPQTANDDLQLPEILVFWPREILTLDRQCNTLFRVTLEFPGNFDELGGSEPVFGMGKKDTEFAFRVGGLHSNFTHDAYLQAVRTIRHYIREGDVYQVNLSQRLSFPFQGDPFELWRSLFGMNPAPFYAFIQAGDHQVLSTSMERFLYRDGTAVETRPIKGTRKRGSTPELDSALKRELEESPKDDAELSMIVDLLRNDLGRVSEPRSIRVARHKHVESYQNVHHLVSTVSGTLRDRVTHGDLVRATFPGGSITGCPKIRAMEIIDELESNVRHVYTGSIGYLGWHENMDLNIAIRTALAHKGTCYFSVGGGIVYDSDEEEEYQETLHKGRTLLQWLETSGAQYR